MDLHLRSLDSGGNGTRGGCERGVQKVAREDFLDDFRGYPRGEFVDHIYESPTFERRVNAVGDDDSTKTVYNELDSVVVGGGCGTRSST